MTDIETAIERIDRLQEDDGVPNNVQDDLRECIDVLQDEDEDMSVRINTATGILDEVSNDPNLGLHTRTEIYNIASMLESANSA